MPVTERDRSRLAALIAIVRPARSLAARVDALGDDHREIYDRYSECMKDFIARNDIDPDTDECGNAWAMVLRGYGPRLPEPIATALHDATPQILKTDTDDNAARKWVEYLQ